MLSPINIEDIINILPELIILFTGSIILINGVTSRSNKISYYTAISGTFIGIITKLILIFVLYENMNYETKKELLKYFEPKNEKLFSLINKEFKWNENN